MVGHLICGASSWAGLLSVEPPGVHEGSHWQAFLDGHPRNVLVLVGQAFGGHVSPDVVRCGRGEGTDWFADVPCKDLSLDDHWRPLHPGVCHQTVLLNKLLHFFVKPWGFPVVGDCALPFCPSKSPPCRQQEKKCHQEAGMAFIFSPQGVPHAVAYEGSPQDGGDVRHSFAFLVVGFDHHLPLHSIHLGVPDEVEDHSCDGLGRSRLHWPYLCDVLEHWQSLVPQDQRLPFDQQLPEAPKSQLLLRLCQSFFS
ncbi:hypothetical protein NDU88_007377 [Pleurodeles waltl]|uniref:Uncharacterized protein n=1 Tax=Pleurodeles waltl TaxID=8319 RepID=A0AAV7SS83_PLEWA|nr:hypothetical protein NDU88_007377 [Pleurodeles waltl]